MDLNTDWQLSEGHFGPLWKYVEDDDITDVDFNGTDLWISNVNNERIKIEEHGITPKFVENFSHYIANNVSKPFNKIDNLLEADTDTLRISIVHESVAVSGRSICIRKTLPSVRITEESAIKDGYCDEDTLNLLINCVRARMNFVICGEPGVGKTEAAKFISQYIPSQDRVITIEDTPEWHYKEINPGKDCVELMVTKDFDYTKAIKTCLRQNPKWIMLSEARSIEAKYLLECWSTGIRGFTTLHTDDVRKVPDRILNMMENRVDADRMENDVYMFIDVGLLIRKKVYNEGKCVRYIDQFCFFGREDGRNYILPVVMDGKLITRNFSEGILKKFMDQDIRPFTDFIGKGE